jgi:excinuclease UvrABC nuclease subunit
VLELDHTAEFDLNQEENFFAALPPRAAVCLLEPKETHAAPLLIRTQDLRRRLQRLLGPPDNSSKRLNLRGVVRGIRYRVTGSRFEQALTYYRQAKHYFPQRYLGMMRIKPPAVLKVSLRNAYPRCYVTRRISLDESCAPSGGKYYGPFRSRHSAQMFAERALDLFKVRRCQIKIRRDPTFPGCMYSEMKMCLAPCYAGCSKEQYDVEVNRLLQFLETGGASLRIAYEQEREQASVALDFERAAAVHKKIEKLDDILRGQPELIGPIQDLHAVILQHAEQHRTIAVFAIHAGRIAEPLFMSFDEIASEPRSTEQLFREYLEVTAAVKPQPHNKYDLSEHLWLLARWYYSHPREGEIFFFDKDWPYRRILRGCSRLLALENIAR